MRNRRALIAGLIALGLFLTACSLGSAALAPSSSSTPNPTQPNPPEPGPSSSQAPAGGSPASPGKGPGDFNLADPAAGLASLQSYRQVLQTGFEGTVNGEQQSSQTKLTREGASSPATELTWLEIDGKPAQFYGRVGSIDYRQAAPDAACATLPVETSDGPASPDAYQPATLPPLSGAEFVDDVDINGTPARHYKFDENAIGYGGQAKAQGEVWVAASGGYVLRYTLQLDAPDGVLGPGVQGVQTWSYELSEVNTGKTSLPDSCQQPKQNSDLPVMDGAKVISQQTGYLVYQVAGGADAAVDFYKKQAEQLGWSAGSPFVFGDVTRLTLRPKDGSLVQLGIEADGGQVTVTAQSLAPLPAG